MDVMTLRKISLVGNKVNKNNGAVSVGGNF